MAWGKILTQIVGMICPPGKPHSGNFFGRRFFTPSPPPPVGGIWGDKGGYGGITFLFLHSCPCRGKPFSEI